MLSLTCFTCVSRLAGSEEEEEEGEWKLYFKLYCFLDVESVPKEGVEFAFMFEQVRFKLLRRHAKEHRIISHHHSSPS